LDDWAPLPGQTALTQPLLAPDEKADNSNDMQMRSVATSPTSHRVSNNSMTESMGKAATRTVEHSQPKDKQPGSPKAQPATSPSTPAAASNWRDPVRSPDVARDHQRHRQANAGVTQGVEPSRTPGKRSV
jgi:hypothetical protein